MTDPLVVVFGAGGRTGSECVRALLEEGWRVRATARSLSSLQYAPENPRLDKTCGDVGSAESVSTCLEGASRVIFAAAASAYFSSLEVDNKAVETVASACKEKGIEQFLLISSCMVTPKNRFSPLRIMLNLTRWRIMDHKFEGEEKLRKSGVPFTIVRPGGLTDKTEGPVKLCIGQGDSKHGWISRKTVAAVCCGALKAPIAINKTFEVWAIPAAENTLKDQLKTVFDDLIDGKYT